MAVLEKERVEEQRTAAAPAPAEAAPKRRRNVLGWSLGILAIAAVAAAVTAALIVAAGSESDVEAQPAPVAVQDFRSDQQILEDLAARGYLPTKAVNEEILDTERLVNRGLIPAKTLEPYTEPPLFTETELLMMHYVNMGQLPPESINSETIELKRLILRGMLPREAVD